MPPEINPTPHADGVTVQRLVEIVRAGVLTQAQALLKLRPELARMSTGNLQVLHHAVLARAPQMVRLLMQNGANAREGIYPHRDATSALTIATDRDYAEIAAIILEEEQRRRDRVAGAPGAPDPARLLQSVASGDVHAAIALLEQDPALLHTSTPDGWTPLHAAARTLSPPLVAWLLDHGAPPDPRGLRGLTPLDLAAHRSSDAAGETFAAVAQLLLDRGAALTAPAAVALGHIAWLREAHAQGRLVNAIEDSGGLLRIAVAHNHPEVLEFLLDCGFDPDERKRFGEPGGEGEVVETWGMPLWHCASAGRHTFAELLLRHGADPNASVYASGTPLYQAYGRNDQSMIQLLERYRGKPDATIAGLYRQPAIAQLLVAAAALNPPPAATPGGRPFNEQLLWAAACGGDPEIVRLALSLVDWPRDDPRWFTILEQPLRFWNHGSGHWARPEWDRGTYLTCFRLLLERCDPDVRGRPTDQGQFALTILHSIAGARDHVTPAERLAFATALLDAGARLDLRDNILRSTPLGWACRWGRSELVQLFLARGADPVEPAAEPWAAPRAWAQKMHHTTILELLQQHGA